MSVFEEDDDYSEELTKAKVVEMIRNFLEQQPLYAPLRFETISARSEL